jgi:hypothetical protein
MPYQPVAFFHLRPPVADREPDLHRLAGGSGSSRRPLAAALMASIVLVLVTGGIAVAAATSPRLSPQGWRAYKGFEAVSARVAAVAPHHPKRAHRLLRRQISRCTDLPGGADPQSVAIRATCKSELRVFDDFILVLRCAGQAGGGSGATGVCALGELKDINRAFDANARATAAVAATLLPGRCQSAFAAQALRSAAAAQSGRTLVTALDGSDPDAVNSAVDAWGTAAEKAVDVRVGMSDQGCRPLPTP